MAFNRKIVDSTSDSYNVKRIDSDDFNSNSIFVPIDSEFVMTFDDTIEVDKSMYSMKTYELHQKEEIKEDLYNCLV